MPAAPSENPDNDVLWTRGLTCLRAGTPALTDISLAVRESEIVALTGPRGSGKSTLLGAIAGQLPSRGDIWFNSIPLHTLPPAVRRRLRLERFGLVTDTPQLLPELTGWENAALPLLLAGAGHRKAKRAALEWLERLDAGDCARLRPARLPLPQQQRIAIARALVHEPALLLADEPTAPLHSSDRVHALRTLVTAARSHGITTLITGAPDEVSGLADRTLALGDGRLETQVAPSSAVPGPGPGTACSLSV